MAKEYTGFNECIHSFIKKFMFISGHGDQLSKYSVHFAEGKI